MRIRGLIDQWDGLFANARIDEWFGTSFGTGPGGKSRIGHKSNESSNLLTRKHIG